MTKQEKDLEVCKILNRVLDILQLNLLVSTGQKAQAKKPVERREEPFDLAKHFHKDMGSL